MVQLGEIDKADDRPPYRQIAATLRDAITAGRLAPGDRLPSENQLVERYDIARMTARQAIQELRTEGLVGAEHGRGVFVRAAPVVRRLASERFARRHREQGKAAFSVEAETTGYTARVDRIKVYEAPAPVGDRRADGPRTATPEAPSTPDGAAWTLTGPRERNPPAHGRCSFVGGRRYPWPHDG